MIHGPDDALVIEVDDIDLLIQHIGLEKSGLGGSPAYVIPGSVVAEDADARRRAEDFRDLVLGRAAGMDLGNLIRVGQITALLDRWSAARNRCGARHGSE